MRVNSATNFFNYFKDCYKLDYKEFTVNNILNNKYKFKWFVKDNEQLINQKSPIIYYDNKDLEKLEKELLLYKLEKSLYYASFYFIGKETPTGLSTDPIICSPLVLYPCDIVEKDDDKFIRINQNDFLLNTSFLNKIAKDDVSKDKLENRLTELFSDKIEDAFEIEKAFNSFAQNIDTSELTFFPQNWNITKIRKQLKDHTTEEPFKIVPASGTVFIEKSIASTKIINDLESIASNNEFNAALKELFNQTTSTNSPSETYLENRLNPEQLKALYNSQKYNNSVIIGPPGTGKSYSISAIAIDAILKKKSVLVVSKTKQAVEVIRENLIKDFELKDLLIHTSGNRFKISLKSKIKKKISGIVSRTYTDSSNIHSLHKRSKTLITKYEKIVAKELKLSNLTFKDKLTLKEKVHRILLQFIKNENLDFLNTIHYVNINTSLIVSELKTYVKNLSLEQSNKNAAKNRQTLVRYYDALSASSFSESKKIIEELDFTKILEVFPLWLAHLSELNTVFPLKKEIFDLVIIDEATQCDIATALPAIYRAKHVVICGDPNQLRHYSFIGKAQQLTLLDKHKLPKDPIFDYRNRSILDIYISKVSNQDQVTFLREHYRSTPSLIEFNNQEFYDQQLEIIKSTTEFTSKKQIEINYINGERNIQGVNVKEANKVIEKLTELIKLHEGNATVPSLGIITPFANQAKHINKLIGDKFDITIIKRFDLLCGTPYNFQGSEREIILISFTVCKNTHHSAYNHLNKSEVLNVGTTRAKSFQYIFTSVAKKDLKQDSLFLKYLSFIENYQYQKKENELSEDVFQKEITSYLNSIEIKEINCGYPYAGSILDVFFTHNDENYFIDLIGYPGQFYNAFTIERYKTFARVGIHTIPLHYRFWSENKIQAKAKLKQLINK
ncbi:DEAD/DEAH box helicase [Cellulophaga sp. L1A9]|uniref:AAA domain-containing protein n=1 Tax=Cellulophaga sp. L1A9 TaxID=2686362 RepID=UPI00131B9059|nr:DEAD/DEAH box helicase [Cellulophaga sp. L1A9]